PRYRLIATQDLLISNIETQISNPHIKIQIYLLPLRVRMLEAKIFAISLNSFKNQSTFSGATRLLSRSNANHNLLSLADLSETLKKFVKSFLLLVPRHNLQ
ncbi:MAG: hypothetical protein QGD94_10035, partial [Planctomycetia bacterium]|nr:hypothetical protein [Planctomycetia bacterium]